MKLNESEKTKYPSGLSRTMYLGDCMKIGNAVLRIIKIGKKQIGVKIKGSKDMRIHPIDFNTYEDELKAHLEIE